jgi:hypothetical protein
MKDQNDIQSRTDQSPFGSPFCKNRTDQSDGPFCKNRTDQSPFGSPFCKKLLKVYNKCSQFEPLISDPENTPELTRIAEDGKGDRSLRAELYNCILLAKTIRDQKCIKIP